MVLNNVTVYEKTREIPNDDEMLPGITSYRMLLVANEKKYDKY